MEALTDGKRSQATEVTGRKRRDVHWGVGPPVPSLASLGRRQGHPQAAAATVEWRGPLHEGGDGARLGSALCYGDGVGSRSRWRVW